MDAEAIACAANTAAQPKLVFRSPNGRDYLCLPRFQRLLTIKFGTDFAEAKLSEIYRSFGFDQADFGIVVRGAGGIGQDANGIYQKVGMYNDRPLYRNGKGMAIYFSDFWKLGVKDRVCHWIYAKKDARGPLPDRGIWDTYGYIRGDANPYPEVHPCDVPDSLPCDVLFTWLMARQPEIADGARGFVGETERSYFDEAVKLLTTMTSTGGDLLPAAPGIFTSIRPVVPSLWIVAARGLADVFSWDGSLSCRIEVEVKTDRPQVSVRSQNSQGIKDLEPTRVSFFHDREGKTLVVFFEVRDQELCSNPKKKQNGQRQQQQQQRQQRQQQQQNQQQNQQQQPEIVYWELCFNSNGTLEGRHRSTFDDGRVAGRCDAEFRNHLRDVPSEEVAEHVSLAGLLAPSLLAERRRDQPLYVDWQTPQVLLDGRVRLVGIGGFPGQGQRGLADTLVRAVNEVECNASIVQQEDFCMPALDEHSRGLYLTPGSVNWKEFTKAVDTAVEIRGRGASQAKPGVVFLVGPLVYYLQQLDSLFAMRFFLRVSREQAESSQTEICGTESEANRRFFEHIAWPAHLAWGQPNLEPVLRIDVGTSYQVTGLTRQATDDCCSSLLRVLDERPNTKVAI